MDAGWRHFPHGSDIGVSGWGPTCEVAFAQAALALTAIATDPLQVAARQPIGIKCQAPEKDLLLIDWLNALIFEMATRHMLFSRFDLSIDGDELSATAWGEPVDVLRHQPAVEVKGATYTALNVSRQADGAWHAQCVVDV